MNTPQLQEKVYIHLDRVRSNRYRKYQITSAINTAIDDYIKDRYDNIKKATPYSFERVERLRQELNTLVIGPLNIVPVSNNILTPPDFQYEILNYAFINGLRKLSQTKSYQESDLSENAFTEPTVEYPIHRRTAVGYAFEFGGFGIFSNAEIYYIKYPREVVFGNINNSVINAGTNVLTTGSSYYVEQGPVTHNANVHQTGETFIAANTSLAGPGNVLLFVDTDLPVTTHEELSRRAAAILSGSSENFDKSKLKTIETASQ